MQKYYFSLILLSILLSGCFGVFMAGAATSGAVVYDTRSLQTLHDDHTITHQANLKLAVDEQLRSSSRIVVAAFNRIVLLVGQAPTEALRQQATALVKKLPKVKRIYNEITLSGPISPLVQSNDAWITTKIKTKMLADAGLKTTQIKVVTENSTVYLMGIVDHQQADTAVSIARKISGVQKVVKLFEYME